MDGRLDKTVAGAWRKKRPSAVQINQVRVNAKTATVPASKARASSETRWGGDCSSLLAVWYNIGASLLLDYARIVYTIYIPRPVQSAMAKEKIVNFRIAADLKKEAKKLAEADGRSLSNWITLLIEREVKRTKKGG